MKAQLLLLTAITGLAAAQGCVYGYDGANGTCRRLRTGSVVRYDAAGDCAAESALLAKITNAFTNTDIQTLANGYDSVWFGLKCAANQSFSCGYDDGTMLNFTPFRNFAPGHPNVNIGTCVALQVKTGYWISSSCDAEMASVCEYDPTLRGSSECYGVSPYADSEKQQIVQIHNDLRSKIALGKFVAKTDKKPPATNMEMMSWSCDLENSAQAWADHCSFQRSESEAVSSYGESIYGEYSLGTGVFRGTGIAAARQWESEFQKKGWPSNEMTTDMFNLGIAAGTQMAWWNSNKIGCGVAECPSTLVGYETMRIVVCHYESKGNGLNQMIYNEGATCSACDGGFTCDKSTGLCKQQ